MLRIGILLPRSSLFPRIGLDILQGVKTYLKSNDLIDQVQFFTDNIGFGIDESDIYTKAEKMLLQEDVQIVIVCADERIQELLKPIFTATNKILIMVNMGANLPETWASSPTCITHTLNFCFHAWLTGKEAAKASNKAAVNIISYYDGGYRICYSFLNSHQKNGGVPAFNHVTKLKLAEFDLQPVDAFLDQNKDVKSALCLFSSEQAIKFYQEILPIQQKHSLQLYASPMMLDAALKKELGEAFSFPEMLAFVPWLNDLPNAANKEFKEKMSAVGNQSANYFSLLGWETGMLVEKMLPLFEKGMPEAAIVQALIATPIETPRGTVTIDSTTHYSYGNAWLVRNNENFEPTILKALENVNETWAAFRDEPGPKGEISSWKNTYLCI